MPSDRLRNDAIADEMLDRLARFRGDFEVRHRVQLTSFGGSATTALAEHLVAAGVDLPKTPGLFPFKHQRIPPAPGEVPDDFRVVYLFGDPRNAVVSVFRRGFQGGHYRGMNLRKPSAEAEQHLTSLERFLEAGVDEFAMENHFDRWFDRGARPYPVLFVRFEALADAWPALRGFVGLPPATPGFVVRPRASEWRALPDPLRARIDEMYGDLARRLDLLPPSELR